MNFDEFKTLGRQMIADARGHYGDLAQPYLLDDELRRFSGALERAIGEISPEEAVAALKKMAVERGHAV